MQQFDMPIAKISEQLLIWNATKDNSILSAENTSFFKFSIFVGMVHNKYTSLEKAEITWDLVFQNIIKNNAIDKGKINILIELLSLLFNIVVNRLAKFVKINFLAEIWSRL